MERIEVLGVPLHKVTMESAVNCIASCVLSPKPHLVVTANPEMIMLAQQDQLLLEILRRAHLVVADGIGAVWASHALGHTLPGRIPGIELAEEILKRAAKEGWRVFLCGGKGGVAEQAATNLGKIFPGLKIVGISHGYFAAEEEEALITKIKGSKPQILFLALGVPRQEKWLAANLGALKIPVGMGVGGSFDIWAGTAKRAPFWLRRLHLEWFYRLLKQPWRIKRMAKLPRFVLAVVLARWRQRR